MGLVHCLMTFCSSGFQLYSVQPTNKSITSLSRPRY